MKFKKFDIKNYLGEIFTGLIIVALLSYLFVGIGIKAKFDEEFWVLFGIGFAIMIAITSIWYPTAKQKAKVKDKNFKNQRLEYSILVDRVVKTNNFKGLKSFCEDATNQNKTDNIKAVLAKINIDYDVYERCKKDLKLIEKEQLEEKQKKKLKKLILYGVHYSIINYSKVTTAIDNIKEHYDVKNEEKKYDVKVLVAKILTSVLCSFGFAMIFFTGQGFTFGKLAQMVTWLVLIFWNICQSVSTGSKSITIHRANYYKKLRTFLEEFFASEYADNTITWERPNITDEDDDDSVGLYDAIKSKDFLKSLAKTMNQINEKEQAKKQKEQGERFNI